MVSRKPRSLTKVALRPGWSKRSDSTPSRSTPEISRSTVVPAEPPSGVRRSKRTGGRSPRAGAVTSKQERRTVLSFNHMIKTKLCVPHQHVERFPQVGHWVYHPTRRVLSLG